MHIVFAADSLDARAAYVDALTAHGLKVGTEDVQGDCIVVRRDEQAITVLCPNEPEMRVSQTIAPRDLASLLGVMVELDHVRRRMLLLDSIVENIPLMVFVKDADGTAVRAINRAGEELLDVKQHELLGKTDHDFFASRASRLLSSQGPRGVGDALPPRNRRGADRHAAGSAAGSAR